MRRDKVLKTTYFNAYVESDDKFRKQVSMNIEKEYFLVKHKISKLSKAERDRIVIAYESKGRG